MFGNPETTPGGRALKFYSSLRIDIRRVTTIKEGELAVGNHVRAKVVKNKVAAPFKNAEFDIMFAGGISTEGDLLDMAVEDKFVDKTGAWFNYGDVRLGQGRENAKQFLKDNVDLMAELREKILARRMPVPAEDQDPARKGAPSSATSGAGAPAGAKAAAPQKGDGAQKEDGGSSNKMVNPPSGASVGNPRHSPAMNTRPKAKPAGARR
jgi:recombination protein RecA